MSSAPAPGDEQGQPEMTGPPEAAGAWSEEYLEELDSHVQALRRQALELRHHVDGMQTFTRNVERILVSVRMMEINLSDLLGRPSQAASWEENPGKGS